jgi:hypothetical protein
MLQVVARVFVLKCACVTGRGRCPFEAREVRVLFGTLHQPHERPCTPHLGHRCILTYHMCAMNNEDRGLGDCVARNVRFEFGCGVVGAFRVTGVTAGAGKHLAHSGQSSRRVFPYI